MQEGLLEALSVLQQHLLELDSLMFGHGVEDLEVFVLAGLLLRQELLLPVLQQSLPLRTLQTLVLLQSLRGRTGRTGVVIAHAK